MLKTNSMSPHYHVYAGSTGASVPFIDLMFDEHEQSEAIMHFFNVADAMVGRYVPPEIRFNAEQGLYQNPGYLNENGILAEYGPFRIVLVKCKGCFSPILN